MRGSAGPTIEAEAGLQTKGTASVVIFAGPT